MNTNEKDAKKIINPVKSHPKDAQSAYSSERLSNTNSAISAWSIFRNEFIVTTNDASLQSLSIEVENAWSALSEEKKMMYFEIASNCNTDTEDSKLKTTELSSTYSEQCQFHSANVPIVVDSINDRKTKRVKTRTSDTNAKLPANNAKRKAVDTNLKNVVNVAKKKKKTNSNTSANTEID